MKTFANLADALKHVVTDFMPRRHSYIVDVRGPDGSNAGQFVDEGKVHGAGFGLTLYLAFDPESGQAEHHRRFLACPDSLAFKLVSWDGIPCYAAFFGTDVVAAVRLYWAIASLVYYNADSMVFECTIYDEGRRG